MSTSSATHANPCSQITYQSTLACPVCRYWKANPQSNRAGLALLAAEDGAGQAGDPGEALLPRLQDGRPDAARGLQRLKVSHWAWGVVMGSILIHPEPPHPLRFPAGFLHRELLFGEHYAEHHGGFLPDTPFWRHLEMKHDLAPARFDFWHPIVGRWIERSEHMHRGTVPPPVVIQPQQITPPPITVTSSVPEPASWLLLAAGVMAIALGRLRQFSVAGRSPLSSRVIRSAAATNIMSSANWTRGDGSVSCTRAASNVVIDRNQSATIAGIGILGCDLNLKSLRRLFNFVVTRIIVR